MIINVKNAIHIRTDIKDVASEEGSWVAESKQGTYLSFYLLNLFLYVLKFRYVVFLSWKYLKV